jgi:hypothetical protein
MDPTQRASEPAGRIRTKAVAREARVLLVAVHRMRLCGLRLVPRGNAEPAPARATDCQSVVPLVRAPGRQSAYKACSRQALAIWARSSSVRLWSGYRKVEAATGSSDRRRSHRPRLIPTKTDKVTHPTTATNRNIAHSGISRHLWNRGTRTGVSALEPRFPAGQQDETRHMPAVRTGGRRTLAPGWRRVV